MTSKDGNDKLLIGLLSCLGVAVAISILFVLSAAVNGWGLSLLWEWFIVPVFKLPPLGIWQAVGVGMVVGFMTDRVVFHQVLKDPEKDKALFTLPFVFLLPLMAVAVGWVVQYFFL